MAITKTGAIKIAAKKAGVTVPRYLYLRDILGLKRCSGCKIWHKKTDFGRDKSRVDGIATQCLDYRGRKARADYIPKTPILNGRSFVPARNGDKKQARRRVNYFVEAGLIPSPNDLPCTDCGNIWSEGETRHEYDHYLGYDAENHERVQPVCSRCHGLRTRIPKTETGEL